MNKKTVKDIDVTSKRVLVRVDFNVPLNDKQEITDETRIRAALPTINYLLEKKAKVILCSHLGRPKGEFKSEFSLKPVAARLSQLVNAKVTLAKDVIGESAKSCVANMKDGEIVLLENVRFHKEETNNDEAFAKALASFADVYVNDAFGSAHRAHASTTGVAEYLPSVAGFLLEKELNVIGGALEHAERPFVAILGGAKVSDKIGVIENLMKKVDTLIIGGGMAYTFFKAKGYEVGKSLLEADKVDLAANIMKDAEKMGLKLLLPVDNVIGKEFKPDTEKKVVDSDKIPADWEGLDIGPKTRELFATEVRAAKTVIWNGPMGVFEWEAFAEGTRAVAQAMADCKGMTIIGGGDSVAAIKQMKFEDKISHISTGGGASLEFMEGKALPGVVALDDK
ncbi:MAG: phosphoglycerate kinase [Eubacteriales bacterium]